MAASLAAYYCRIPVGHVEAGLRTKNKFSPFPEEVNRHVTGVLADIHFAPTEQARENLLREGIDRKSIHVTGNTVIDALLATAAKITTDTQKARIEADLLQRFPTLKTALTSSHRRMILVTGHRRENFGNGFENICAALSSLASAHPDTDIVYPAHLNPNVLEPVQRLLGTAAGNSNIHIIEPLEYLPFVYLMTRSYMIITDSGGVQEEAPSLGKPILVMRDTTERPEALIAGTVKLVGTDQRKIVEETTRLLCNESAYRAMSMANNPYGDGKASIRIVDCLAAAGAR
jgi:UDP-N-acetylglucosamine 2-epimerase (non-hydrolysing)